MSSPKEPLIGPLEKVHVDSTGKYFMAIPDRIKKEVDALIQLSGRGVLNTLAKKAIAAGRVRQLQGKSGAIPFALIQPEDLTDLNSK